MVILKMVILGTISLAKVSAIHCDGYKYPEIERPYNLVNASKALAMAKKNEVTQNDIQAFTEAINVAVGSGAMSVNVKIPYKKLCPGPVKIHLEKLGYKVESTNEKCSQSLNPCFQGISIRGVPSNGCCPDWGYCKISWE